MASRNLRLLSLGFMLIALCMHHCSARKALMEDLDKQEKAQHKGDMKPAPMPESSHGLGQDNDTMSKEGEIGLDSCGGGCVPQCNEQPCPVIAGGVWVPTAPIVTPQPPHYESTAPIVTPRAPHLVPTPPLVTLQQPHLVPTPPLITPAPPHWEPIYVPEPPPCTPCEPWNGPGPCPCPCEEGAADMESIKTDSNNKAKEGEMHGRPLLSGGGDKMEDGAPSSSRTADAPMAAMMDGSNVHA